MGNGLIYSVPRFQRDYSWTDVEWEDLWEDILQLFAVGGEPEHYMGYLVLQSSDNKKFDIIDSQQRLTTLSIFTLAVLKNFDRLISEGIEPENNVRRRDQLRSTFIGYLNPVTLIPQSKLTLNRNNDAFYQNFLVPLEPLPQRGRKATEHQMRKAFEWFETRIWQEYGTKRNGASLAELLDKLSDKLFFTEIVVGDELNAYKVFETLNARGVKLSSTDLLKNYLFSVVHREINDEMELNVLDEKWEILVGKLGSESFPDFLRSHWNSRNKLVRSSDLFKTIRGKITNRREVFDMVREMEKDADVYAALSAPEDEIWSQEQRAYISELKLFNVRQLFPLLLCGYRKLEKTEFTLLLKICSIISFRYNVIGNLPTNDQERVYTAAAEQLQNGQITTLAQVIDALKSIYPNDANFNHAFSGKVLRTTQSRNKKMVRYILFKLEQRISDSVHDIDSDLYSLEHILPENPASNWEQFTDQEQDAFVYRLGNMTMMKKSENRELGNAAFAAKRDVFSKSSFKLTQKIAAENNEWTAARIDMLQKWMAGQAQTIWRVSQLS